MTGYIHFPQWLRPEIIPGLPIRWYGLMYIVAFTIAYLLFNRQVKQRNLDIKKEDVMNFFFWLIIGLLAGARIFSVFIYDPTGSVLRNPLSIILPFRIIGGKVVFTGFVGMSYHGGLVGAVVAAVIYCRRKKFSLRDFGDMLVAGVPLGYTFGRLGNFINGELYGRVTAVSWGMIFPDAEKFSVQKEWVQELAAKIGMDINGATMVNLPRHPSQLYEAFFEGMFLWLILWFLLKPIKPFKGFLLGSYVVGYGVVRFFIEYFREPDKGIGFPITLVPLENPVYDFSFFNFATGQILCFIMVIGGCLSLYLFWKRSKTEEISEVVKEKPSIRKLRKKIK